MKLRVRNLQMPNSLGPIPVLCTEDGTPLPSQRRAMVVSEVGEPSFISVDFVIGTKVTIDETA